MCLVSWLRNGCRSLEISTAQNNIWKTNSNATISIISLTLQLLINPLNNAFLRHSPRPRHLILHLNILRLRNTHSWEGVSVRHVVFDSAVVFETTVCLHTEMGSHGFSHFGGGDRRLSNSVRTVCSSLWLLHISLDDSALTEVAFRRVHRVYLRA